MINKRIRLVQYFHMEIIKINSGKCYLSEYSAINEGSRYSQLSASANKLFYKDLGFMDKYRARPFDVVNILLELLH